MPIVKQIIFSEGVSVSSPTSSILEATALLSAANDAAFVTAIGRAALNGDIYYNTTTHQVRIYQDGAWTDIPSIDSTNTLTNKTINSASNTLVIDADTATVSNIEVDNLKSGVLDTDLSSVSASDDTIPSAKATKTALDLKADDSGVVHNTGNENVGGIKTFTDTTTSTTKDTGAVVIDGGLGVEENVNVGGNVTVTGDLTVNGTTTTVDTNTLEVKDPNITVNNGGNQTTANTNVSGVTVEMSDATDARIGYDSSATSKFKCGELGSEVEIADISSSQTLTNKTLTGPNINGTIANTLFIGDNADTDKTLEADNGDANNPKIRYVSANDRWEFSNDGTTFSAFGSGSGGGVTYVDLDFEAGETSDIVGSTGITAAEETTNPLFGSTSAKISKDAADRSGGTAQVISFTIDEGMQNQILQIAGYVKTSANYADEDASFRIYDLENSEYVTMLDGDGFIYANDQGKFFCRFQTSAFGGGGSEGQYRLDLYIESTNASAYDITLDEILINDQQKTYGPPVTDMTAYTPTLSDATNVSTNEAWYRRVGDSVEITGFLIWNGNGAGSLFTVSLPSGLTVDTAKVDSVGSNSGNGYSSWIDNGTDIDALHPYNNTLTTIAFFEGGANNVWDGSQAANGDTIRYTITLPIAGWSSNVAMSTPDANREIHAEYKGNGGTVLTANVTNIDFNTSVRDTAGAWDGDEFTAPDSGVYHFEGNVLTTSSDTYAVQLYVDGSSRYRVSDVSDSTQVRHFSGKTHLTKGEKISFRSTRSLTLSNDQSLHWVSISKENSGSQIIAAEEKIIAVYQTNTADSFTNSVEEVVYYDEKVIDTHNAVTAASFAAQDWIFTAPATRKYMVEATHALGSTATFSGSEAYYMDIKVDGVSKEETIRYPSSNNTTKQIKCFTVVEATKGQTIHAIARQNSGGDLSQSATDVLNRIKIYSI